MKNNCCEKCEGLDRGSSYDGYQPICSNLKCLCHQPADKEEQNASITNIEYVPYKSLPTDSGEEWETWVRTLATSTNPRDVDLLITKISVLLASEREKGRKEGAQPMYISDLDGNNLRRIPDVDSYEAGHRKGIEEAIAMAEKKIDMYDLANPNDRLRHLAAVQVRALFDLKEALKGTLEDKK